MLTLCVTVLAIFLASFFSTVSGFGYALIATPILSTVIDIKFAIMSVLVTTVVLRAITMWRVWGTFDWNTVLMTTLGSGLGTLPGSYALKFMTVQALEIFLGSVLLVATFLMSKQYMLPVSNKKLGRLCAGIISGFFGSSTSVGGPPLVLYFLNEKQDKNTMRANMIWIFGLSGMLTMAGHIFAGNLNAITDWNLLLPMLPAMFIGIYLGEKFFFRLNQHLFKRMSIIIVCCGAVSMLISGIRGLL